MFTNMKNIALAAGVSAIALSGSAFADEKIMVSAIDVESSVSASTEANAMDFYPDLEEDLRAEVAERVPMSSDAADPQIKIDIRKIALNGSTMLPDSKEFNQLEGVVDITSPNGDNAGLSFPVMISAYAGDEIAPEGYVNVQPSETEFYVAMVSTFADVVAEGLANVNTAGDPIDP
ncbi:hypothetical protein DSM110093_01372 [Sulfitobacter sp. DSM 110093]|uniref:hypothetical protein n=1 Tax=Sulfitobacter sp. DSM 110093 TaxID=2883127 RepID=UPI001FAE5289|nr:hypothetical protein [Sulfitobacter sp. DSM 110093]UOA31602.1 hypothetical protein DSM110093_01372 [Sulfitobacter sp. DSM 110093]